MRTRSASWSRRVSELDLVRTGGSRVVSLGLSTVASLVILTVVVRRFGADYFALYAIVASFVNLVPFADLGLGAGVVNATADRSSGVVTAVEHASVVRKTLLLLVVSAAVLLVAIAVGSAAGVWPALLGQLGELHDAGTVAALSMCLVAVAIPFGAGGRALQGLGKMREVAALSAAGPVCILAGTGLLLATDADPVLYALLPAGAYLVVAVLSSLRARRLLELPKANALAGPSYRTLLRDGLPFLLISVGLAVGFQSHRLLLSHFGDETLVAEYSLAAQMGAPLLAVLSTVGQNLWSRYRRQLGSDALAREDFQRHVATFAVVGTCSAVVVALACVAIAPLLTGGALVVPPATTAALGFYVLVVAVHQPGAMLLTDRRGLWSQAGLLLAASAVSVPTTVLLVPVLGSAAPYVGFGAAMLLLQVVPTIAIALRRIGRDSAPYSARVEGGHVQESV